MVCFVTEAKVQLQAYHIFSLGRVSQNDSFLNVTSRSRSTLPGQGALCLGLSNVVCQEVKLDCNTVHTLLDLPNTGVTQTAEIKCKFVYLRKDYMYS